MVICIGLCLSSMNTSTRFYTSQSGCLPLWAHRKNELSSWGHLMRDRVFSLMKVLPMQSFLYSFALFLYRAFFLCFRYQCGGSSTEIRRDRIQSSPTERYVRVHLYYSENEPESDTAWNGCTVFLCMCLYWVAAKIKENSCFCVRVC